MADNSTFIELMNVNDHVRSCLEHHLQTYLTADARIPGNTVRVQIPGLEGISLTFGVELTPEKEEWVTETLLSMAGYTGEDLKRIFMDAPDAEPLEVRRFADMIGKKMAYPIYVLSDFCANFSAVSVIKAMPMLKEQFGKSLYIYFISEHAALFIPYEDSERMQKLLDHVIKSYTSDPGKEGFLSNHLYLYDIGEGCYKTLR